MAKTMTPRVTIVFVITMSVVQNAKSPDVSPWCVGRRGKRGWSLLYMWSGGVPVCVVRLSLDITPLAQPRPTAISVTTPSCLPSPCSPLTLSFWLSTLACQSLSHFFCHDKGEIFMWVFIASPHPCDPAPHQQGFDALWTLASFACIVIFGGSSISLTLRMRNSLEPQIVRDHPGYPSDPRTKTIGFHLRYATEAALLS